MFTYQFNADDMPVLSIIFKVGIPHDLIVLKHGHPVLFVLQVIPTVCTGTRRNELFDSDCVRVEVLESQVGEECDFIVFVECQLNVCRAWLRGLGVRLVRDSDLACLDVELWFARAPESIIISVIVFHH